MSTEPTVEMSNVDAASLRDKINAFAAGLTPGEATVLASLLERASRKDDNDTSGYFWWFFQPQYQPGNWLVGQDGASFRGNSLIGTGVATFRG